MTIENGAVQQTRPVVQTLDGRRDSFVLRGAFLIATIEDVDRMSGTTDLSAIKSISLSDVSAFDTAGAWFVETLLREISQAGGTADIVDASQAQLQLLNTVRKNMPTDATPSPRAVTLADRLEVVGKSTVQAARKTLRITSFFGAVIMALGQIIVRPRRMRGIALVHHMQEVGLNAVPIVSLLAFLIGVVLAFQGATQLRQFGAEVFVVDLISISVLRELGILLTAIIVAGRSGAAFTAAVGSMKMREEIDAMRTLGLDPIEVLVVPRVLALLLMLPVLGFVADIMGLVGGALMSWIELGVSPAVFQSRLIANTDVWHFGVGMIKAPFFAIIIGIIGCYEGMQVEGNAESLGRLTSTSVVFAIFMVILTDAVFSIFFALVGV